MTDNEILLLCGFGFLITLCIYFVPAVVASRRDHPHALGIFLLDLFLGWTLIGWVVALVWAFSDPELESSGPYQQGMNAHMRRRQRRTRALWVLSLTAIAAAIAAVVYHAGFRPAEWMKRLEASSTVAVLRRAVAPSNQSSLPSTVSILGRADTKSDAQQAGSQKSADSPDEETAASSDSKTLRVNAIAQGFGAAHQAIICADLASVSTIYRKSQAEDDSPRPADLLPGCELVPTGTKLVMQPALSGVRVRVALPSGEILDGMTMREMVSPL